jgi:hypothetical protein
MRTSSAAIALAVAPLCAAAQSYQSVNLLDVVPLNGSDFEVIEANGEGPRGIWCAAADFAEREIGASTTAELYVKRERGPSVSGLGRTGVSFTLDQASLSVPAIKSYSVTTNRPGLSLPVGHAIQFCRDYIIDLSDL